MIEPSLSVQFDYFYRTSPPIQRDRALEGCGFDFYRLFTSSVKNNLELTGEAGEEGGNGVAGVNVENRVGAIKSERGSPLITVGRHEADSVQALVIFIVFTLRDKNAECVHWFN